MNVYVAIASPVDTAIRSHRWCTHCKKFIAGLAPQRQGERQRAAGCNEPKFTSVDVEGVSNDLKASEEAPGCPNGGYSYECASSFDWDTWNSIGLTCVYTSLYLPTTATGAERRLWSTPYLRKKPLSSFMSIWITDLTRSHAICPIDQNKKNERTKVPFFIYMMHQFSARECIVERYQVFSLLNSAKSNSQSQVTNR